jgi:hypothetical protein
MPSFGFFLGLELWDISFDSYDLIIYTNVLCTYRKYNFSLQKTRSGQIGITTYDFSIVISLEKS